MEVVMRLRDLLAGDVVGALLGSPEMDPLTEKDALQEARLNEVTFDAVRGRVGLLFDLRGALQLRMAYTGLLVLGGVEKFSWSSEERHTARTAWNVVASLPVNEDGVINLRFFFHPGAELTVVARSAAFFAGDVPGLPDTPPDFAGSDEEVAPSMASMDSSFEPTQGTFVAPLFLPECFAVRSARIPTCAAHTGAWALRHDSSCSCMTRRRCTSTSGCSPATYCARGRCLRDRPLTRESGG
jgi:hypothetical protein